jgi:hypothetical protein
MQSKLRPTGQSKWFHIRVCPAITNVPSAVKDSVLPTLTLISHPALQTSAPFKQVIKAHPRLIDQSFTYTVPASKHSFHVIPYLPPSVTSRAYRIFVLVNGMRISPFIRPGEEQDRSRPVYEARLERGSVGRIEVEVLAERAGGKDEGERERVGVFVHVMRS